MQKKERQNSKSKGLHLLLLTIVLLLTGIAFFAKSIAAEEMLRYSMALLFVLSQWGYLSYLVSHNAIPSFAPLVSFSLQTMLIFLSGFVDGMRSMEIMLLALGLFLFVLSLPESLPQQLRSPGLRLFLLGALWAFLSMRMAFLYHTDNFNFWAIAAKLVQLYPGHRETIRSGLNRFSTYPVGMAVWEAYVCRFFRMSCFESSWLFAKNLMNVGCIACLACFMEDKGDAKKKNAFASVLYGIIPLVACVFLCCNSQAYHLLIDDILALMSGAVLVMLLYGFDRKKPSMQVLPVACLLPLIKNGGYIYLAFLAIIECLLLFAREQRVLRRKWGKHLLLIGSASACTGIAWQVILRVWGVSAQSTDQGFSFSRFITLFNEKSASVKARVLTGYIAKFTEIKEPCVLIFVLFAVILTFLCIFTTLVKHKDHALYSRTAIGLLLSFGLYFCSLLLTYFCSMTESEALRIACFFRYFGSFAIMFAFVVCGLVIHAIANSDLTGRQVSACALALALPLVCCYVRVSGWQLYSFNSFKDVEGYNIIARSTYLDIVPNRMMPNPDEKTVLQLVDDVHMSGTRKDGWYNQGIIAYSMLIPRSQIVTVLMSEYEDGVFDKYLDREGVVAVYNGTDEVGLSIIESLGVPCYANIKCP